MAEKSQTDLAQRTLQKMGILAAGETASHDDAALVKDVWASVRLELIARNVGGLSDADAIPLDIFEGVADYVAIKVAPDFGRSATRDDERAALSRIYAAGGNVYTGNALKPEFF